MQITIEISNALMLVVDKIAKRNRLDRSTVLGRVIDVGLVATCTHARSGRTKGRRCRAPARIVVLGRAYCRLHAKTVEIDAAHAINAAALGLLQLGTSRPCCDDETPEPEPFI
ncbi:hypothetical protein LCGC14_1797450 [marine sediment metagenome]|uniref:Uncharacterized protein n=1 Tax=marine sediment metagenome TaxID=412755 RepID=A0A0F9GQR3_9ZZZZ